MTYRRSAPRRARRAGTRRARARGLSEAESARRGGPRWPFEPFGIEFTNAVINVVTDAIGIDICRAVATTNTEGVEQVAVAVAGSCRDVSTSTFINRSVTIANTTFIFESFTYVDVFDVSASAGLTEALGGRIGWIVRGRINYEREILLFLLLIVRATKDVLKLVESL